MRAPLSGHRHDDVAPLRRSHDGALARWLYLGTGTGGRRSCCAPASTPVRMDKMGIAKMGTAKTGMG